MNAIDHDRLFDVLQAAAPKFPSPVACRALGDQFLAVWRATDDNTYLFGAEASEMMAALLPMAEAGADYSPVLQHVHRLLALAR